MTKATGLSPSLPMNMKGVIVAAHMHPVVRRSGWHLDNLAGRLVELSGNADTAALTLVAGVLLETQQRGESAAWITAVDSLFYPPDLAMAGIDLSALPVIRVKKGMQAARAADALLRSGGFGTIVMDLGNQASMSLSVQTRLAGLTRRHDVALLALTRRVRDWSKGSGRSGSLGSMVSLWGESRRERTARDRFACELRVRKDKQGGGEWRHLEFCRGPDGLC
jgi:recombination protein RecA